MVHRNLGNPRTKGKCSEITFMLSTSIDSVFTIKSILQLYLLFCACCNLKFFLSLAKVNGDVMHVLPHFKSCECLLCQGSPTSGI